MTEAGLHVGARWWVVHAGLDQPIVHEVVVGGFGLSELVVALHSYDKFILSEIN